MLVCWSCDCLSDAVETEELTRPWSAGHCDGHSDSQTDDQPSQRRQSGQSIAISQSH